MDAQALATTQQSYTRVSRKKLIARLKETKTAHVEQFEIAIKGYRKAYHNALRKFGEEVAEATAKAEDPETDIEELEIPRFQRLVKPENHAKEYDQAIARFSMSLDPHIWLSHRDFNQLVMDDWDWRVAFVASARLYAPPGVYTNTTFASPELSADFLENNEE